MRGPILFSDAKELVMARARLERRTNDALGEGGALERGQPKISDFDRARRASNEDVVTLEISVQDGGHSGM